MAKRRNLKKEKVLRNEAYTRKFRKRTSRNRMNRRRPMGSRPEEEGSENKEEQDEGAVDR